MSVLNNENSIDNRQTIPIYGNNQQASALERPKTSMEIIKIMSENEKLDEQMRYGTDYINLPTQLYPTDQAPTWIPQQEVSDNSQSKPQEIRYLHHIRPSTTGSQISRDHYANHQQMDAENRLYHLEIIRPKENMNLINAKFHSLQHPRHARPILPQYRDDYVKTLYDQTGTYIQERSGLYHTDSYEPYALAQAIPELEKLSTNNPDDLDDKNQSKLFQYKALGDYETMRNNLLHKFRPSNDAGTIDSRTQEGNKQFVQTQSSYGQGFNTPKFLQENTLSYHARIDPNRLMSTRYNTNLQRVRSLNSYPSTNTKQEKTNDTLVSPILHPSIYDEIYTTKLISEHTNGYSRRPTVRVYNSPFRTESVRNFNQFSRPQTNSNSFDPILSIPTQLPRSVKTAIRLPGPEIVARFIDPTLQPNTTYQRSYKDISYHESKPAKQDNTQQNLLPTSNNRIKQWKLKDLQDRWSKTQAQEQYHVEHPEIIPDVGHNTIRAKKEILIADTIAKKARMTIR